MKIKNKKAQTDASFLGIVEKPVSWIIWVVLFLILFVAVMFILNTLK